MIQVKNGVTYFHSWNEGEAFASILVTFLQLADDLEMNDMISGKAEIKPKNDNDLEIVVYFTSSSTRATDKSVDGLKGEHP
jgi:hypothetical protein